MDPKKFQEFLDKHPDYKDRPREEQLVLYGHFLTLKSLGDPETIVGVVQRDPRATEAVRKYFEKDPEMENFYRERLGHPEKAEAKIQRDWDIIHAQTDALLLELVHLGLIPDSELESMPEVPTTYSLRAKALIIRAARESAQKSDALSEREKRLNERKREIAEGFVEEEKRFYDVLEMHANWARDMVTNMEMIPPNPPDRKTTKPGEYPSSVFKYLDDIQDLLYNYWNTREMEIRSKLRKEIREETEKNPPPESF